LIFRLSTFSDPTNCMTNREENKNIRIAGQAKLLPVSLERSKWILFKEGCNISFEFLLNYYYPQLLNYGLRLRGDQHQVRDSLQNFFIDLWNTREGLDTPVSIKAYLFASFRRRLFRDRDRNLWTKLIRPGAKVEDHVEVQLSIESYMIHNEIRNETLLELKKQLSYLTSRQREALYLRFYQELEYDEIAKIMSIQHHSVVNLVYEAIRILRKNWVF
jgi:RNA polymerase sigma factor (sigma-70 family)